MRIAATEGSVLASAVSGPSGGFAITLRRSLISRHSLTLTFRHPDFRPFDIFDPSGEPLYVVRLTPIRALVPLDPEQAPDSHFEYFRKIHGEDRSDN